MWSEFSGQVSERFCPEGTERSKSGSLLPEDAGQKRRTPCLHFRLQSPTNRGRPARRSLPACPAKLPGLPDIALGVSDDDGDVGSLRDRAKSGRRGQMKRALRTPSRLPTPRSYSVNISSHSTRCFPALSLLFSPDACHRSGSADTEWSGR